MVIDTIFVSDTVDSAWGLKYPRKRKGKKKKNNVKMKLKWGFKKVSCRACLILIVLLLILFHSLSSNYSDLPTYDSESSKRCTLRL